MKVCAECGKKINGVAVVNSVIGLTPFCSSICANKHLERNTPDAGKKFDYGKPPIGLISTIALQEEAKVLDFGKQKYDAHNWRKGMKWSRLLDAALRHILAYNESEDKDPETGLSHLAHARCCLGFLLDYEVNHPDKDDRYKK